jgi:hypothetical protein
MNRTDYETLRYALMVATREGGITIDDETRAVEALDWAVEVEKWYETEFGV